MSGLEVIGVAASIIQVADLGAKLSVKLFSFYQRVKNASDSVQLLSNEIALVSAILRELGDNLKEEEASKLCSKEAFRTLNVVLDQSRDVLGQIQRVIDDNDQRGKGRFQQVAGKLRIAYHESSLDQLKKSLERLKATMLLLLNVITYAGQIRSNKVPSLAQAQRDLIQSLLQGQNIDNEKPQESDATGESERDFPPKPSQMNIGHTSTDYVPGQKGIPHDHRPTRRNRNRPPSVMAMPPLKPPNEASHGTQKATESTELKEYNLLIRSMLVEIESCKQKLKSSRYSRIKDGILNIHSGEIIRFQIEHRHPIDIDQSLFALDMRSEPLSPTIVHEKPPYGHDRSRSSGVFVHPHRRTEDDSHRWSQNEELPVMPVHESPTSLSPGRHSNAPVILGATSPAASQNSSSRRRNRSHREDQHVSSKSESEEKTWSDSSRLGQSQRMLERNDQARTSEFRKQQQEIERLDRELAKYHKRPGVSPNEHKSQPYRHEEVWNSDEGEIPKERKPTRRRERMSRQEEGKWRRSESERRLQRYEEMEKEAEERQRLKRRFAKDREDERYGNGTDDRRFQPERQEYRVRSEEDQKDEERRKEEQQMERGKQDSRWRLKAFDKDEEKENAVRQEIKTEMERRRARDEYQYGPSSTSDSSSEHQDFLINMPSSESATTERVGDGVSEKEFAANLSLPGNLGDLLAQWTTLDREEIHREQFSMF